jgi:hypothetical protein
VIDVLPWQHILVFTPMMLTPDPDARPEGRAYESGSAGNEGRRPDLSVGRARWATSLTA